MTDTLFDDMDTTPADEAVSSDSAEQAEAIVAPQPAPAAVLVTPAETEPESADAPVDTAEPAEVVPEVAPVAESEAPEPEAPADELAEAIAEAGERVDEEPTLDDIAPGTVASTGEVAAETTALLDYDLVASTVSWWPFGIYMGAWAIFAAVIVWQFLQAPTGTAVFDAQLYPYSVLGGVVLTIAGPLLIVAAWVAALGREGVHRGHLFVSALIKGAVSTAVGVTLWWVAILVLDQLRLGKLL